MTSYADDTRFPGPDPYAPLRDLPSFGLSSTDLVEGDEIPEKHRAPESVSPQLAWSGLPEGTKSLAVTCFDPDAPTASGFWHWAVADIPVSVTSLSEGAGDDDGRPPASRVLRGLRGHEAQVVDLLGDLGHQ
mgnify:CR=1 FL=1